MQSADRRVYNHSGCTTSCELPALDGQSPSCRIHQSVYMHDRSFELVIIPKPSRLSDLPHVFMISFLVPKLRLAVFAVFQFHASLSKFFHHVYIKVCPDNSLTMYARFNLNPQSHSFCSFLAENEHGVVCFRY